MKRRVRSLFLPYICWNILSLFAGCLICIVGSHDITEYLSENANLNIFWDAISTRVENFGPLNLSFYAFTPLNGPLWFIRDLMAACLLSPLLYMLIKWTKGYVLILFGLLYCTNTYYPIMGISLSSIFFFSIGAYFSINSISFAVFVKKYKTLIATSYTLTAIPAILYDGTNTSIGNYVYPVYVICAIFMFLLLATQMLACPMIIRKVTMMKKHVFFIYGSHVGLYTVSITAMILSRIIPDTANDICLILRYLATIGLVSLICIALSWLTNRTIPAIYNIITGSR